MAWTKPTAEQLKARWPRDFSEVDNELIQFALDEAALQVGDGSAPGRWISEGNWRLGYMLFAAHILTLDGIGASSEAQSFANGAAGFRKVKSGSAEFERFSNAAGERLASITTTVYGQRYANLAAANGTGPLVIGGNGMLPSHLAKDWW